jgi:hypothetical protein
MGITPTAIPLWRMVITLGIFCYLIIGLRIQEDITESRNYRRICEKKKGFCRKRRIIRVQHRKDGRLIPIGSILEPPPSKVKLMDNQPGKRSQAVIVAFRFTNGDRSRIIAGIAAVVHERFLRWH